MYTLLYLKWITDKDLLDSTRNSAQYYVATLPTRPRSLDVPPLAGLDLPSASLSLILLVCPSRMASHAHIKGQLLDSIMAEQLEEASEADFPFSSY